MTMEPKIYSFSGGETSAKMLLDGAQKYGFENVHGIFANTGREHPDTLDFVQRFSSFFNIKVTWVEAVVHHGQKKGCTHRIVSHNSASRDGEPFEEMIKKYGIPNLAYKHCTRELKANSIKSYLDQEYGDHWSISVGIRYDESKRHPEQRHPRFHYPLIDDKTIKADVNVLFEELPFRLPIPEYLGNCKDCFKKLDGKLCAVWQDMPEAFDFTDRMECKYGLAGNNEDGTPRVFYRGNRSAKEMIKEFQSDNIKPWVDQYRKRLEWEEDDPSGCGESCEPLQAEMFAGY